MIFSTTILKRFVGCLICMFCFQLYAQDELEEEFSLEEEEFEHKNSILVSFGYTYIPDGAEREDEGSKGFFVPSIGLDYAREIGERWELLLMLDWELSHYVIVKDELEREKAFISIIGAAYRPFSELYIFAGAGMEFEKNENLFVTRLGAEYMYGLNERWFLAPAFFFDFKKDFPTYTIAVGLKYKF